MNPYRGTNTHKFVFDIGNKLGYKFRPWEAVKWTKRIANVSRGIAVVGTVVSVGAQLWADKIEDDDAKNILDIKISLRAGFTDAAEVIELQFNELTNTYEQKIFKPEIDSVDAKLKELRERKIANSKFEKELHNILRECQSLITEMHKNSQLSA